MTQKSLLAVETTAELMPRSRLRAAHCKHSGMLVYSCWLLRVARPSGWCWLSGIELTVCWHYFTPGPQLSSN